MTSGPPFAGTFSPNSVTLREVGTLTFEATDVDNGTLTYTVDGTLVTKSVTRQLWKYENFTGNYYGGLIYDLTQCANPANNGHIEELGTVNINHSANNTITVATQTATATASGSCNYTGTYTQAGHMGTMQGSYTCTNGISGTFVAFEMEKTISGMTGRFVGSNTFCQISGHFGGLLR